LLVMEKLPLQSPYEAGLHKTRSNNAKT